MALCCPAQDSLFTSPFSDRYPETFPRRIVAGQRGGIGRVRMPCLNRSSRILPFSLNHIRIENHAVEMLPLTAGIVNIL
jgi:hypothetical protein